VIVNPSKAIRYGLWPRVHYDVLLNALAIHQHNNTLGLEKGALVYLQVRLNTT